MDINQELIDRFYQGVATQAEIKRIAQYIYSDQIEASVKAELEAEYQRQQKNPEYDVQANFDRIQQQIETSHNDKVVISQPHFYNPILKLAASISIILVAAYLAFSLTSKRSELTSPVNQPEMVTKITGKGQKLHLTLPDGSRVVMNANTRIAFPDSFSENSRMVELNGEAFFEVVKDSLRPFEVLSEQIRVEVLGTSFNIKSGGNQQEQVALVEGSLKVSDTVSGAQQLIAPGDLLIHREGSFTTTTFDYEQTIAWKDGMLYFQRENLEQIISKLENWYGLEFEIQGSRPEVYHYSGKFRNKSLEEVLKGISYVMMFDFNITGDEKVIITLNTENM